MCNYFKKYLCKDFKTQAGKLINGGGNPKIVLESDRDSQNRIVRWLRFPPLQIRLHAL